MLLNTLNRLMMISSAIVVLFLVDACSLANATTGLGAKLISKRQAGEQEQANGGQTSPPATTSNDQQPASNNNNNNNNNNQPPPARLYPDLPQPPTFLPPFNGPRHHNPSPFSPFGLQAPNLPTRLNADQAPAPFGRVLPIPRPTTAAERLQSQSFADGLGRRLMSMVGINIDDKSQEANSSSSSGSNNVSPPSQQVLQNATVLQQLSKGVNNVYSGLSKMYNSTIQEQLNLLQEKYKAETANSTNPWHQRMAMQVPQFFKQMAGRISEAQDQLNRVWRDIHMANSTTTTTTTTNNNNQIVPPQPQDRAFIDQFMGPNYDMGTGNFMQPAGQFFNQQFSHVRDFWNSQVQPQVNVVRQQVGRVWQDLAASGTFAPIESVINRSRNMNSLNNAAGQNATSSTSSGQDLIDNLLKEIDPINPEYSLIDSKTTDSSNDAPPSQPEAASGDQASNDNDKNDQKQQQQQQQPKLSAQMQNGLVNVQRELNKAWLGLSSSIQNALGNVRQTLEPRPVFATFDRSVLSNQNNQQQAQQNNNNPAESEITGKIRDLSKLQRDADMVNAAIQQQQRETQQNQMIFNGMERFKSFFNQNFDISRNLEELPNRVGQSVSRLGTAVGDLWNQMPERWDNLVSNIRPTQQPQMNAKFVSPSSSQMPSTNSDKSAQIDN